MNFVKGDKSVSNCLVAPSFMSPPHPPYILTLNAFYLDLLGWHPFLVLSNLRDVKISLNLQRNPDVTILIMVPKVNHTHIHTCKKKTTHKASVTTNFLSRPSCQFLSTRYQGTKQVHPLHIVCKYPVIQFPMKTANLTCNLIHLRLAFTPNARFKR